MKSKTITANMATIPARIKCLELAIGSIVNQVDQLNVYLNNFNEIPECLNHPNIKLYESQKHKGDLGDAGKFYKSDSINGYCLTIDDDIIYPADYVVSIINKIEQYDRKYAISVHGRILLAPMNSYYKDSKSVHCRAEIISDTFVHVLGTGVLAYHTDTIKVSIDNFPMPNMADIWFAMLAQKQKVGLCVMEHRENWLEIMPVSDTIHDRYKDSDSYQTTMINQIIEWKIFGKHS